MKTAGAVLLLVLLLTAAPARAYVREVTDSRVAVAWRRPCVDLRLPVGAPPPYFSAERYLDAAVQAAAVWSFPQLACTNLRLAIFADPAASAPVGFDRRNVIVFRQDSWCRESPQASSGAPSDVDCYPASALAVTTVTKNSRTGEILDTDIELNAVNYAWADLQASPELADGQAADFQNALTHELGHVIGLDHDCYTASDGQPRLPDNTGAPELDCYGNPDLPASIAQATMYPSVSLSDTQRRVLSADDRQGACDIYPYVGDYCPGVLGGSGCAVEPRPVEERARGLWAAIILAGALAACVLLRRLRS